MEGVGDLKGMFLAFVALHLLGGKNELNLEKKWFLENVCEALLKATFFYSAVARLSVLQDYFVSLELSASDMLDFWQLIWSTKADGSNLCYLQHPSVFYLHS